MNLDKTDLWSSVRTGLWVLVCGLLLFQVLYLRPYFNKKHAEVVTSANETIQASRELVAVNTRLRTDNSNLAVQAVAAWEAHQTNRMINAEMVKIINEITRQLHECQKEKEQ